jgi:hypothetical protein
MAVSRHQTDEGKPAFDRGIPPHKHGYHAAKKKGGKRKIWFAVGGTVDKPGIRVPSPWTPGKRKRTA